MTEGSDGHRQLYAELNAAWAIAKKDIAIYYFKPNIIVIGALFPLFMFLAFAAGNSAGPSVMIPGLIAITILFSASSIEPVSIPLERRMKTFDRLVSAPISMHAIILGESLSGFLYSIGIAIVPLVAGLLIFGTPITSFALLVAGILLTSFCFATMGTLFAAYPTESPGDIMSMLNLVRLPLILSPGSSSRLNPSRQSARLQHIFHRLPMATTSSSLRIMVTPISIRSSISPCSASLSWSSRSLQTTCTGDGTSDRIPDLIQAQVSSMDVSGIPV